MLLFRELIKKTHNQHRDFELCKAVLAKLENLTLFLNESKRRDETQVKHGEVGGDLYPIQLTMDQNVIHTFLAQNKVERDSWVAMFKKVPHIKELPCEVLV
eukprot:TRINITY_DN12875_c0_g1_i1.p1 TRINITY_DN12875_c0_g1~~TRINITY_DN12875_c0_g1_i1.p1  ORF type:complete len:101 (+),score=18.02 TRINITY_DN12875_c0_g1_i1:155-457(+)